MQPPHTPHSWISERKKNAPHIAKRGLSANERFALFITKHFGTMTMFYVLAIWMIAWPLLAMLGFGFFRHDPYPFTFLLFVSNIVQLLALPILAVGQQIISRSSERQAERTYKDAETILKLQDEIHRLLKINNDLTEEIRNAAIGRGK